jgi:thymidylate synthase ThyX
MPTETMTELPSVPYFHEPFTDAERDLLRPHFTDLDGPVFAIVNLPEVVKGALFARYSRSPKSVRRLFLDEFVEPTEAGLAAVAAQREEAGEVGIERAEALYRRVFSDYGDDSVAQLGGAHLACEQASNVLTKVLERGRLAAYLEQSTRYIFYDERMGGRYRYMTPPEVASSPSAAAYEATMESLFDTYADLVRAMVPYYEAMFPRQDGDSAFTWRSTIRARACDDLRGLLPASTLSNVGIFGTGQSYEMLLVRMAAHPSAEVRRYGAMMLAELRQVIPSFLHRVDNPDRGGAWSEYFAGIAAGLERTAGELDTEAEARPEVTLVDWDPEGELKTAAAALYPHTDLPDDQLLDMVRAMGEADLATVVTTAVGDRSNRRHKPGRGFERTSYRFDILCDYGIFRDLQRHRMLTVDWQRLTPAHGYVTPAAVVDVGAEPRWQAAMERAAQLHAAVAGDVGPNVAQYVVPLAYRVRFILDLDAREAFHLIELRSQAGGHPDYRRIAQTMHRLIAEQAGHALIAGAMTFVDHDDHELARLDGERRAAARRAAAGMGDPD